METEVGNGILPVGVPFAILRQIWGPVVVCADRGPALPLGLGHLELLKGEGRRLVCARPFLLSLSRCNTDKANSIQQL